MIDLKSPRRDKEGRFSREEVLEEGSWRAGEVICGLWKL